MLKNLVPVTVFAFGPVIASDNELPAISVPVTVKVTPEINYLRMVYFLRLLPFFVSPKSSCGPKPTLLLIKVQY